jgi:nicotinate-nucleotide adenylyltransferase
MTRVALFGGTFDPPHRGHLAIARAAAEHFQLDRVLFAPAGKQPLKATAPGASYADRLAMVQLAIAGQRHFEVTALDAPHADGSANYTVETLSRLCSQLAIESAAEQKVFYITGADAFLDLRRWRQPELLLELAEWIVVSRPGFSLADLTPLALTPLQRSHVHLLEDIAVDVSATQLREALRGACPERSRRGLDVDAYLPPAVGDYIRAHHLYTR